MSVSMALIQFVHEFLQQPDCDLICTIIIITVSWEVSLDLEVCCDTVFVTDCFNLCILDST